MTCGTIYDVPHIASRGPGRPPAAKAAETRERILGAAREVFSELGYDAATFQAIAERADLTRPAINHYFANKRVLWREVVAQTNALVVTEGMTKVQRASDFLGRLSAFLTTAMQADAQDRSAAAFLVTSVLEVQRHPDLQDGEHDLLKSSRQFVSWAVNDAVEKGELSSDTDIPSTVEMLVAVMWGMGFYAGYVGDHRTGGAPDLGVIVQKFELLMANRLWRVGA